MSVPPNPYAPADLADADTEDAGDDRRFFDRGDGDQHQWTSLLAEPRGRVVVPDRRGADRPAGRDSLLNSGHFPDASLLRSMWVLYQDVFVGAAVKD